MYEISDRSIQREQFCVEDYARDYGWVVGVYMCVLCVPLLIQYSHRDQNYILQPNLSKYAVFMNTLLCRGGYRCGVPRDCGCVHVWSA